MKTHRIEFPGTTFAPIELATRSNLSLHLTVQNSPLLFGCRSGLCGTCLIEVETIDGGALEPPDPHERETLELYAPDNPRARLACQLPLSADLKVWKIAGQ